MKRNVDWQTRLFEKLDQKRNETFVWGVNDCAMFASDLMESMTGTDPAAWFRDRYDSKKGAYFSLHRSPFSGEKPPKGFNDLFSTVVSTLAKNNAMKQIEPSFLQRGDLVLVEQSEGLYAMGILVGSGVAVPSRDAMGYELMDRPGHKYCWRVSF